MKTSRILFSILLTGFLFATPKQIHAQCTGKTDALETIGMQGGLVLYNTYEVIGTMNDGYLKDAWTKETVISILDEQISMLKNMAAQYDTLMDSKFLSNASDRESLQTMRKGVLLLKREAQALEENINNPSDENSATYQAARSEVWSLIAKFLGFADDEGK